MVLMGHISTFGKAVFGLSLFQKLTCGRLGSSGWTQSEKWLNLKGSD